VLIETYSRKQQATSHSLFSVLLRQELRCTFCRPSFPQHFCRAARAHTGLHIADNMKVPGTPRQFPDFQSRESQQLAHVGCESECKLFPPLFWPEMPGAGNALPTELEPIWREVFASGSCPWWTILWHVLLYHLESPGPVVRMVTEMPFTSPESLGPCPLYSVHWPSMHWLRIPGPFQSVTVS
jgi:hypothetical protein